MLKLCDLYDASEWSLYTPNGELIDANFIINNRNMVVENIDIYTRFDLDDKCMHIMGLKVYLYDSIYKDTDSVVTP